MMRTVFFLAAFSVAELPSTCAFVVRNFETPGLAQISPVVRSVLTMGTDKPDPKERKGATMTIRGEGARSGYFRTSLKNTALFRAVSTEYARSADGCVLTVEGRRSSIEGLSRWCTSKKPGQGPGLSTLIVSADIEWMDNLPNISTKWADKTSGEFAFEELTPEEVKLGTGAGDALFDVNGLVSAE